MTGVIEYLFSDRIFVTLRCNVKVGIAHLPTDRDCT